MQEVYRRLEFACHFESNLAQPSPFYMHMRTTISDEHSIVTMLRSIRIIFSTYSMFFSRDKNQLPVKTGSLGVVCSVVILKACSPPALHPQYRLKLSTIFEPFCPASNHETVLSNALLLISTLKMSIWTCAQRTHGT